MAWPRFKRSISADSIPTIRDPMKAIIYAAKSTEDEHGSIPTQLDDGRGLAATEKDISGVDGEYADEAASAWSGDRGPQLAAAMEHAERIAPCVLIVQHSDRLARGDAVKARHLVEIVLWAMKFEITIRSVQDDFFDDPRIALTMGALMGQRNTEDSKRKSLAVKAGMKRRRKAGKHHGGPPAFGTAYRDTGERDGKGRPILEQVPIKNLVPTIKRIFSEYVGGRSQVDITKALIKDKVPTAKGGRWHQGTVSAILANDVYVKLGIIDEETWKKSVALRQARTRTPGKGRGRPAHRHLFNRGMLRCGECGEAMIPRTIRNRRSEPYEVYLCYGHDKTGDCTMPPLRRAEIDSTVYGHFEKVSLDVEATRQQFAEGRDRKLTEVRALLADAEAEAQRATDRLARVRGYFQDGRLDPDDWADQRDQLTAELDAAQAEADRLRDQEREVESWGDLRDVEADTLRHLSEIRRAIAGEIRDAEGLEAVRAALSRLFERFVVHHGKDLDHAISLMDERKMGEAVYPRPGPSGVRLVIQPIVREAAIVGYERDRTPVIPAELAEEIQNFTGGQHGPIDWAEFERWRGAPVEWDYETVRGRPILRREGLSQAENKYANGLTT